MARLDVEIHDGPLSKLELKEAAVVGARAFHPDPFFEFLSPDAVLRAQGLSLYCLSVCAHLGPKGQLLTARHDGRIVGVAAWIPPGGYPYPAATQAAQALGALHGLYHRPAVLLKSFKYINAIERAHPKDQPWYLQLLVCDPAFQRRGVGGALQERVLEQCDREGTAAYLETQNHDNLAYYGRFGYELVDTLNPVKDGPPLWTLRREPRTSDT